MVNTPFLWINLIPTAVPGFVAFTVLMESTLYSGLRVYRCA